eukprot:TRINITY_DN3149_c0_g1_i1.p1 TRINITY_DN3149_c0_g1~~TRINITY_DN3149_c0_g1_i1.p1  ORF type:complete len:592 (+),score=115.53 TRINITY_DN3149_c0_g1_i1:1-1776(+)
MKPWLRTFARQFARIVLHPSADKRVVRLLNAVVASVESSQSASITLYRPVFGVLLYGSLALLLQNGHLPRPLYLAAVRLIGAVLVSSSVSVVEAELTLRACARWIGGADEHLAAATSGLAQLITRHVERLFPSAVSLALTRNMALMICNGSTANVDTRNGALLVLIQAADGGTCVSMWPWLLIDLRCPTTRCRAFTLLAHAAQQCERPGVAELTMLSGTYDVALRKACTAGHYEAAAASNLLYWCCVRCRLSSSQQISFWQGLSKALRGVRLHTASHQTIVWLLRAALLIANNPDSAAQAVCDSALLSRLVGACVLPMNFNPFGVEATACASELVCRLVDQTAQTLSHVAVSQRTLELIVQRLGGFAGLPSNTDKCNVICGYLGRVVRTFTANRALGESVVSQATVLACIEWLARLQWSDESVAIVALGYLRDALHNSSSRVSCAEVLSRLMVDECSALSLIAIRQVHIESAVRLLARQVCQQLVENSALCQRLLPRHLSMARCAVTVASTVQQEASTNALERAARARLTRNLSLATAAVSPQVSQIGSGAAGMIELLAAPYAARVVGAALEALMSTSEHCRLNIREELQE